MDREFLETGDPIGHMECCTPIVSTILNELFRYFFNSSPSNAENNIRLKKSNQLKFKLDSGMLRQLLLRQQL